jgi:hypothetical protein
MTFFEILYYTNDKFKYHTETNFKMKLHIEIGFNLKHY